MNRPRSTSAADDAPEQQPRALRRRARRSRRTAAGTRTGCRATASARSGRRSCRGRRPRRPREPTRRAPPTRLSASQPTDQPDGLLEVRLAPAREEVEVEPEEEQQRHDQPRARELSSWRTSGRHAQRGAQASASCRAALAPRRRRAGLCVEALRRSCSNASASCRLSSLGPRPRVCPWRGSGARRRPSRCPGRAPQPAELTRQVGDRPRLGGRLDLLVAVDVAQLDREAQRRRRDAVRRSRGRPRAPSISRFSDTRRITSSLLADVDVEGRVLDRPRQLRRCPRCRAAGAPRRRRRAPPRSALRSLLRSVTTAATSSVPLTCWVSTPATSSSPSPEASTTHARGVEAEVGERSAAFVAALGQLAVGGRHLCLRLLVVLAAELHEGTVTGGEQACLDRLPCARGRRS